MGVHLSYKACRYTVLLLSLQLFVLQLMVPLTSAMRTASAPNLRVHLHLLLLHRMVAVTVMKLPTSSIFLSQPHVGHVKVCYYDVSHVQC